MKDFLINFLKEEVTFIPIGVKHKSKILAEELYIINPVNVIDCLDLTKSDILFNRIDPSMISSIKKLALKPDTLPGLSVFRIKYMEHHVVVSEHLRNLILKENFEGIKFFEITEFRGF